MSSTTPSVASSLHVDNATIKTTITKILSSTGQSLTQDNSEVTPIFLQTKTAQAIAGIFVFCAIFLTCQQVRILSVIYIEISLRLVIHISFCITKYYIMEN